MIRAGDTPVWVDGALCAQTDPEAFYPEKGRAEDARRAKAVCAACPVIDQCREWALTHHERYGIWGGLSEKDRRKARRSQGVAA